MRSETVPEAIPYRSTLREELILAFDHTGTGTLGQPI